MRSGLAYQAAAFLSAGLAVLTLPAYTKALGEDWGNADLVLTWVIFLSIFARLGFGEALLRHWYTARPEQRPRLQRTIQWSVAAVSAVLGGLLVLVAPWFADSVLSGVDPGLVRIAGAALLIYCNLDLAQALLRARDDRRTYLLTSVTNVLLTVTLTVLLVVVFDRGVRGFLVGNYVASTVVLLFLWARELPVWLGRRAELPASVQPDAVEADPTATVEVHEGAGETAVRREAASSGELRPLLRFGLPTVPSDAAIFGFNLLDRTILKAVAAGVPFLAFTQASKIAVGVILVARAFQLAFPPLAYSIRDAAEASKVYASAVRGYVIVLGGTVAGVALCAPWTVHVLVKVGPDGVDARPEAISILALLATAWALWGLVPVMTSIAGRLGATRLTVPAAVIALAVNALGLLLLVPEYGAQGAALALVIAYVVLLVVLDRLTRRYFPVRFDWRRIGLAIVICGATCLLAGPLAPAPDLGWVPAGERLLLFAAMIVLLWRLTLLQPERAEVREFGRRLARRAT